MAGIDYGSVVYKNRIRYQPDKLYPEIKELGVYFYKTCLMKVFSDTTIKWFGYDDKKSYRFEYNNSTYKIKEICSRVYYAEIRDSIHGDTYDVIFGYGIDNSKDLWNKIKVQYLGKKNSKKVDKYLNRFEDWKAI